MFLVTGASGQLGQRVIHHLVNTGVFQGSCHYLLNYQAASFSGFR